MSATLEVIELSKTYPGGTGEPVAALEHVSLTVKQGEFVSIVGPSGCGKTTLLNIIGGLVDGYSGTVRIEGKEVNGASRGIGMVFQEESIFPWRTTLDNVAFPLEVNGMSRPEREERARHFVRLVGLDGFEGRYPAELSGGMRQRTAVARALAYEPRMMLLDEPFGALDEQTRMLLGDKLLEIRDQLNQTMLLITHSITEAVQLSDRVVVMSFRPGRVKRVIDIDLPRPRTSEALTAPEFGRYVGMIWADLREEAARGMVDMDQEIKTGRRQ
jgi:NitT/TauT family transport system ATP-binding protein